MEGRWIMKYDSDRQTKTDVGREILCTDHQLEIFISLSRLRAGRPGLYSRQGQGFFSRHSIQTGSVAHPAPYPLGTGGLFSCE
jgi:hypothetical protein